MAMTLLKGGPKDGEIVQTSRNEFGFALVTETWKRNKKTGAQKLVGYDSVYYEAAYERAKHPAKKIGTVKVFKFCPKKPKWAGNSKRSVKPPR